MAPIVSENGLDVIFVYGWIVFTYGIDSPSVFIVAADFLLVRKRDLGVWDHGRQKESMSSPALRTLYPTDSEMQRS